MSCKKRVSFLVSSVFVLVGCEAEPGPGVPRAPLPSEIKQVDGQEPANEVKTRSMQDFKAQLKAKKAEEDAAKRPPVASP